MATKKYSFYKRGQIWYCATYEDGKRRCFTTRQKDRERAVMAVEGLLGSVETVGMEDVLEHYITFDQFRSPTTEKYADYFFRRFATFIRGKRGMTMPASIATQENVKRYQDWLMSRELSPTSIKIEMGAIRAILKRAHKSGLIEEDPFRDVRLPKPNSKAYFLSSEDVQALLKKAEENPLYLNYIKLLLYSGCRGGELRNLKWKDIHENYLEFDGKTGMRRFPLNGRVKNIVKSIKSFSPKPLSEHVLVDYRTGRWIGRHSQLGKIIKKYIRKAKLDERYTAHSLRHTFASHLVMQGVDLYTVSKLLGHASVKMTERYAHLRPELLQAEVKY
jgi:site-specific recombinase XerD